MFEKIQECITDNFPMMYMIIIFILLIYALH